MSKLDCVIIESDVHGVWRRWCSKIPVGVFVLPIHSHTTRWGHLFRSPSSSIRDALYFNGIHTHIVNFGQFFRKLAFEYVDVGDVIETSIVALALVLFCNPCTLYFFVVWPFLRMSHLDSLV